MNYHSLIVVGSAFLLVGGGCSNISQRYAPTPVAVQPAAPSITKETINLNEAELFLRSRDDVKPGQADVNQQSLFAKTKDGQIVEIIKDVHEALEGKLLGTSFLVLQKDIPVAGPYVYFVNDLGDSSMVTHQLFAFDKESKKFVTLPITLLTESQNMSDFQYSSDHTKVAVLRSEPEESQVIYIVDLKTGQVMSQYNVADTMTMTDPANSDLRPVVAAQTKWTDNTLFQVALFKRTQVPNGKNVPDESVVIDTARVLSVDDLLKAEYSYDHTLGTLFARSVSEDPGVAVATAIAQEMEGDGPASIFSGVSSESPFVFFTAPTNFGYQDFVGIYDKRSGKFLKNSPFIGKSSHDAVLSKSGKLLATFEETGSVVEVQMIDLVTLKVVNQTIDTKDVSLNASVSGMIDSEGFGEYGPNAWTDENTLVVYLYKNVDIKKQADKEGKFSAKQPFVKTLKFKFE